MKHTLTFSALIVLLMVAFASCKKTYYCHCNVKTVVDVNDTVKSDYKVHSIKALEDDAKAECKPYETEEDYLGRYAVVYHMCEIKDTEHNEIEVPEE